MIFYKATKQYSVRQALGKSNFLPSFQCVTEGRFPHPNDCGSYIDCLPDTMQVHSCNGGAFHPIYRTCVALDQVSDLVCVFLKLSTLLVRVQFAEIDLI